MTGGIRLAVWAAEQVMVWVPFTDADPEPSLGDASPICGDHKVDGSYPPFRLWSNKTYYYYYYTN